MKYSSFKRKYAHYPIIKSQSVYLEKNVDFLRRQLSEWKHKNWIISLKKGFYVINELCYRNKVSALYIANQIYEPSYISLEYVLSAYDLIPEKVFNITSITTRKTDSFTNDFGQFNYYSVKKNLFFGFKRINYKGQLVYYAEKEKAFLDFCYLRVKGRKLNIESIINIYRFQNLEYLNFEKLQMYVLKFGSKKLLKLTELLQKYLKINFYQSL